MAIAVDGTGFSEAEATATSPVTITHSTGSAGCILLLIVGWEGEFPYSESIASVHDTESLAWTRRKALADGSGNALELWWAYAAGAYSGTVTVTFSVGANYDDAVLLLGGMTGVNTTTPFDANPSLPTVPGGVLNNATVTTSTPNDYMLAIEGNAVGTSSGTPRVEGTYMTLVAQGTNVGGSNYEYVDLSGLPISGILSSAAVGWFTDNTTVSGIIDALQPAAPPPGSQAGFFML